MSLHSFELQKTIFNALSGNSALTNLITGVFDDVPENQEYPYVVVGEETSLNIGCKTKDALEHTLTIHSYSRERGRKQVKQIMSAIYEVLHESNLSVSGASLINLRNEFETVLLETDGITRHGVLRFRAVVFDED